jgi:hypothetical protein
MAYMVRKVVYESVDVDSGDLVTLSVAARLTRMSMPGLVKAVERGRLTEIIDDSADYHGRRLLLRREVEAFAARRGVA